jgi:hypothetical protein
MTSAGIARRKWISLGFVGTNIGVGALGPGDAPLIGCGAGLVRAESMAGLPGAKACVNEAILGSGDGYFRLE